MPTDRSSRNDQQQSHDPTARTPNRCIRLLAAIDIFSYIPVPQSFPVSTRKSKIGSIVVIMMILGYIIYDFVQFLTNNVPTLSIYDLPISDTPIPVPQMAIGFIYGPGLNQTLNNPSYFTISFVQTYQKIGQASQTTVIPMTQNCNPQWMGNLTSIYSNLSCINASAVKLQGLLFGSYETWYPRFVINLCVNTTLNSSCVSQNELYQMTAGGRIFLFTKKQPTIDYNTGKPTITGLTCEFANYFLVPYLYNRVNLIIEPTTYDVFPDYLTSFQTQSYEQLVLGRQQFQNSNVSVYSSANMLSISILLASKTIKVEVHYDTIITHISLWGALWSVLFSLFALFFLGYNKKKFTKAHPDWEQFDKKVAKLQNNIFKTAVGDVEKQKEKETELADISTLRRKFMETTE